MHNPFLSSTQVSGTGCSVNVPQGATVIGNYSQGSVSLPPISGSMAGQFQLHPVSVMPSQSTAVTSQAQGETRANCPPESAACLASVTMSYIEYRCTEFN